MDVSFFLLGLAGSGHVPSQGSSNWFWIVVIVLAVAFVLWLVSRGGWNNRDRMG